MFVEFDTLPDYSRLWVYQASRRFSPDEAALILQEAHAFCDQWNAHGNALKTSCAIAYGQFLVLAVDEGFNGASGCSIDGSVHMLKSLQDRTGIDFFDRTKVPFLSDGEIRLIPVAELKEAFASGTLSPATETLNILATDVGTWRKQQIVQAGKTWMTRFLPKTPVA